jgi:hypothetical protein
MSACQVKRQRLLLENGSTLSGQWKDPSIISRTGAAIWSEVSLGPTGHHYPDLVSFLACSPFTALLLFIRCILKVVFCAGVRNRLRYCLNHLNYVKMAAFQQGWWGTTSILVLVKSSLVEKEEWDGELWRNRQPFCHQRSRRSLRTCSRSCRNTSQ